MEAAADASGENARIEAALASHGFVLRGAGRTGSSSIASWPKAPKRHKWRKQPSPLSPRKTALFYDFVIAFSLPPCYAIFHSVGLGLALAVMEAVPLILISSNENRTATPRRV